MNLTAVEARALMAKPAAKRSKYGAKRTSVDGVIFDSAKEANRYAMLRLLEKAGKITNLQLQPEFKCMVNGNKICTYKADFCYDRNGENIVEDVKSKPTRTPVYKLKVRLMAACHPDVDIVEV